MSIVCTPDERITEFLENIGVDTSKTRKVVITIEVDSAVIVEIEQHLEPKTDGEWITKKYNLIEVE